MPHAFWRIAALQPHRRSRTGEFLGSLYKGSASRISEMLQTPSHSIETRASWVVAFVALLAMMMSFGAAWITAVALKDIASELDGARSVPALASSLAWL